MRWNSSNFSLDFVPLLLRLKSLPDHIRRQLAREISPKSDDSICSFSRIEEDGSISRMTCLTVEESMIDVQRWVDALEDEFEPMMGLLTSDEDEERKSTRTINTNVSAYHQSMLSISSHDKTTDSGSPFVLANLVAMRVTPEDAETISDLAESADIEDIENVQNPGKVLTVVLKHSSGVSPPEGLFRSPIAEHPQSEIKLDTEERVSTLNSQIAQFFERDDTWEKGEEHVYYSLACSIIFA